MYRMSVVRARQIGMNDGVAGWVRRSSIIHAVTVLALGLTLAACGDETDPGGAAVPAPADDRPTVTLSAPDGTDAATLGMTADVVRARLARMGVTDAEVTVAPDGVTVTSGADAYQLRAAAQPAATSFAPVVSSTLGPCAGAGTPAAVLPRRCYELGPPATDVGALTAVDLLNLPGSGWGVAFSIDPAAYAPFRAALASTTAPTWAVVADGAVVLEVGQGVPALQSAIGPPLAEETARLAAATLLVDSDLPVALEGPPLPDPASARIDVDFWTAALGVHVCGTWLDNAPAFGLDTGVHSHGDGLVYVHPFQADEAGDRATLGLLFERGGWSASLDRLQLWDGVEHRSGTTCPDGRPAHVRWWVDGVEQTSDPARHVPRHGEVIVLAFDPDGPAPGPPPQMAALHAPPLTAAAGG